MRVCIVTLEWPPYGCGIGTYMYNLARGLVADGHEVTVITHDRNPLNVDGVRFLKVPVLDFKPSFWLRLQKWRMEPFHSWSKLAFEVFRSSVSKGDCYDIVETAEYGAWGRHFIGGTTPLVVRCHNSTRLLMESSARGKGGLWLKVQDHRERTLALGADGLACPSTALADWLRDVWGVPSARIRVIPNPIDGGLFRPGPGGDMTIPNEILFVGRLEKKKGVFDFADAVAPLLAKYPQLRVRYVGLDMPAPNELSSMGMTATQVIKAGLPVEFHKRIEFTGHIPVAEIIHYWQRALCAVVPSRLLESFSYVVIEAMACGCPVIASRKGGPLEIITHEIDGLLIEPEDVLGIRAAIARLVDDPLLRENLSRNARHKIETRYSIEVVTKSIIQHYQESIDSKTIQYRSLQ